MATPFIADVHLRLAVLIFNQNESELRLGARQVMRDLEQDLVKDLDTYSVEPIKEYLQVWYPQLATAPAALEEAAKLLRCLVCNYVTPSPPWLMGIYDHFKGGVYKMGLMANDASNGGDVMNYTSLTFGTDHTRKVHEFGEVVMWPDGEFRSRFVYRGPSLRTPAPSYKVPDPI